MEKQHVRREVPLWVALTRTVAGRVRVCVCGAETLFDGRMNGRKNAQTSEQNANENIAVKGMLSILGIVKYSGVWWSCKVLNRSCGYKERDDVHQNNA